MKLRLLLQVGAVLAMTPVLLITEPVLAQLLGCRSASPSDPVYHHESLCSGNDPSQQIVTRMEAALTGRTTCRDGWKAETFQLDDFAVLGLSVCGWVSADTDPWYSALLDGPYFWGEDDTNGVIMSYGVQNMQWVNNDVRFGGWETGKQYFNAEGCCGGFCSDPYGCNQIGEYDYANCRCVISPILLDLDGDGYHLTSWEDGVVFDMACTGHAGQVAWTQPDARDAFLALDRDGDGLIEGGCELFGSASPQPTIEKRNGFNALRPYDSNADSRIDERDAVYDSLLVWVDTNHDGVSQPDELSTLASAGVVGLSLQYDERGRRDPHGNMFRYAAKFEIAKGGRVHSRWAYDIFWAGSPGCLR